MDEYSVEKGGRKKYRGMEEQQGIVAFCTCQWNEKGMNEYICENSI